MLILHIDSVWEPHDFVEILQSIESMYYKLNDRPHYRILRRYRYFLDPSFFIDRDLSYGNSYTDTLDHINRLLVQKARFEVPSRERLVVYRIQYASPGGIDLLGLGKAVESIMNSIQRIVSYYDERHLRRERDIQASLETERKRIEVERDRETLRSVQIENARKMLELERDFPDHEREALLPLLVRDQDGLSQPIADGRLVGAETKK